MSTQLFVTIICFLVALGGAADALSQDIGVEITKALVSENVPPKLVETNNGKVPLFPDDFDWDDQLKVRRAFVKLGSRKLVDNEWKQLLAHTSDESYSLTMTEDGRHAQNYNVGDLCKMLIEHHVTAGFRSCLPVMKCGKILLVSFPKSIVNLDPSKALADLQLEGCKAAVDEIETNISLTKEQKTMSMDAIRSKIRELERSRIPIFESFPTDAYDIYSVDAAVRLKKSIGSGP